MLTELGGIAVFLGALVAASMITETGPGQGTSAAGSYNRSPPPPLRRGGQATGQPVQLSAQEMKVLGLLGQGFTNPQIATKLGISPIASATIADDIRERFGAQSNTELLKMAREQGFLPPNTPEELGG